MKKLRNNVKHDATVDSIKIFKLRTLGELNTTSELVSRKLKKSMRNLRRQIEIGRLPSAPNDC
jgi:hypothetical protein